VDVGAWHKSVGRAGRGVDAPRSRGPAPTRSLEWGAVLQVGWLALLLSAAAAGAAGAGAAGAAGAGAAVAAAAAAARLPLHLLLLLFVAASGVTSPGPARGRRRAMPFVPASSKSDDGWGCE